MMGSIFPERGNKGPGKNCINKINTLDSNPEQWVGFSYLNGQPPSSAYENMIYDNCVKPIVDNSTKQS